MSTTDWMPAAEAPEDVVVLTKIDDGTGCRNEQAMYRLGNLWWVPDGSMYVYYRPTHYRPLTPAERHREGAEIDRKFAAARSEATAAAKRLSDV